MSCFVARGNRARILLYGAFASIFVLNTWQNARADSIPYPNPGTYNSVTYSFNAMTTGEVIAYFAGSGAGDDNQVGLLINGVLSGAGFGLDDKTSSIGDAFDMGTVHAGDSLVFVMKNLTVGGLVYSDPSLNIPYDDPSDTIGHNHIYATAYTATPPLFAGVPPGVYVGFEDEAFPNSDFNYSDETFVVTNVAFSSVPEPSSGIMLGVGVALVIAFGRRLRNRVRPGGWQSAPAG